MDYIFLSMLHRREKRSRSLGWSGDFNKRDQ